MVAVWPGMGHVASSAGYYLMAKLGMQYYKEFPSAGVFDVDYALVKSGIVQKTQRPRNRIFVWHAPEGKRDLFVFIGEAQPPLGKYKFTEELIEFARQHDVERVFTFAAMATEMLPEHDSRVFAAATDKAALKELDLPEVRLLEEGHISGLNGVLLAAAIEHQMRGVCLLGEMPHLFAQLPFPKASLAVLRVFTQLADIPLDFRELEQQSRAIEQQLGEILAKVEQRTHSQQGEAEQEFGFQLEAEPTLTDQDQDRIERLFMEAAEDRSKAYELKGELDRLGVFDEYEDRFLDLFKHPE